MCAVGEDIEASGITGEMVAGKPAVALLCDKTYQENDRSSNAKAKRCKHDKEVFEGVQHPNALRLLARQVEYRFLSQLQ